MIAVAEPLINVIVGSGLACLSAVIVAWLSNRKIHQSHSNVAGVLRAHAEENNHLFQGLRDEIIARHRVASHAIDRGVYESDEHGQCVFVNVTWTTISGLSAPEALGDGWQRAIHPEDVARVTLAWRMAVHTQERFGPMRYRFMHPDGTVVEVHSEAYPTRNGGGRLRGFVGWVEPWEDTK